MLSCRFSPPKPGRLLSIPQIACLVLDWSSEGIELVGDE